MMAAELQCKRCGGTMDAPPALEAPAGSDGAALPPPRPRCPKCGGRTATRRLPRARFVGRQFGRWHEFHVGRPAAPDPGAEA